MCCVTRRGYVLPMVTGVLLFYFTVLLQWYVSDMGGSGLALPQNIICWIVILFIVMLIVLKTKKMTINRMGVLFLLSAVLFSLPLMWTKTEFYPNAIPRLMAIWGGWFFFVSLSQCKISLHYRKLWLLIILSGCFLQTVLSFFQFYLFSYTHTMEFNYPRPYGIFQQVNVLATFIATGYGICLYFQNEMFGAGIRKLCLCLLFTFMVMMPILQSQIGEVTSLFLLALYFYFSGNKKIFLQSAGGCSLAGVIVGLILCHLSPEFLLVSKAASNHERLFLYKMTWMMILQHPLSGWGLGSFEKAFLPFQAQQHAAMTGMYRVTHPHNEILYMWMEGGILAAAGILIIVYAYIKSARHCLQKKNALWILPLPIVAHMMTEFPLQMSTAHWLVLLIFCTFVAIDDNDVIVIDKLNLQVKSVLIVILILSMGIMISGFYTQMKLTAIERGGFRYFPNESIVFNAFSEYDRFEFDRHMAQLMAFNHNRELHLLDDYVYWSTDYLSRHNNPLVLESAIRIADFRGDVDRIYQLRKELDNYSPAMVAGTR